MQAIAPLFYVGDVGFNLLRRNLFFDSESALSCQTNRHGFEAVIVAGDATGFRGKTSVAALKQGETPR